MKFLTEENITKIRQGFYSAAYFNRTKHILLSEGNLTSVTMQIFQKQDAFLCGINEVVELLQQCTGYFENGVWKNTWGSLIVEAAREGQWIKPWESVMHITGPYAYFSHLESLYLGILARRTLVATNTKKVVDAAATKQVAFFADRFDYFLNQEGDGYAAKLAGVSGVATDAQGVFFEEKGMGTIPHALIAMHQGNTVAAAESFANKYPNIPLIVLVDFDNNCVKTATEVAKALGDRLYGVRIDTSEKLIDASLQERANKGEKDLQGVCVPLVQNVRHALDNGGFGWVKIIVSGGFNAEKVAFFEKQKVSVDMYGVGSSLVKGSNDFTADIVKVDGKEIAKFGRSYQKSKILQVIA